MRYMLFAGGGEAQEPTGAVSGERDPSARSAETSLIASSVQVVDRRKTDPQLSRLMQQAKGIFIVPERARGDQGPAAFLLMSQDAVNQFKTRDGFSLDASAGLTSPAIPNPRRPSSRART